MSTQYSNFGRPIFSRKNESSISIQAQLVPGQSTPGCLVCCASPVCCPICSIFPCFDDTEYIKLKRDSSKYVYIRENSLEWNDPQVIMKNGSCFGVDPCNYDVQDNVKVLYFDDPIFDRLTDQTRCCNELRTCLCGGKGERIRMDSPFCCCLFLRLTNSCLPCLPICCPTSLCPCILRYEIHLEDAQQAIYEIRKHRHSAINI